MPEDLFQLVAEWDPSKLPKRAVAQVKEDGVDLVWKRGALIDRDSVAKTNRYPEIASSLPKNTVLRLEMVRYVTVDGVRRSHFNEILRRAALQNLSEIRLRSQMLPCTAYVHDILELDGKDLRSLPYEERRKVLEGIRGTLGSRAVLADEWPVNGPEDLARLQERIRTDKLEGLVIKDLDAPYVAGRPTAYMKWKAWVEGEFDIKRFEQTAGDRGRDGFVIYVQPHGSDEAQRVVINDGRLQALVRGGAKRAKVAYLVEPTQAGRLRQPHIIDVLP